MVSIHFAILVVLFLFAFSIGRTFGRAEAGVLFNKRLNSIISALQKVETLASLKGEDISKLSTDDLVHRAKKQLKIADDTNE